MSPAKSAPLHFKNFEILDPEAGELRGGHELAVDGRGLPLRVIMTPVQDGDNPQLLPLLDGIRVARPGPGHPRSRPEAVPGAQAPFRDR